MQSPAIHSLIGGADSTDVTSKKKVDGRLDQRLEVQGSIFNGRDENQILKQQKYIQQNEIRRALEMQILEKKRILDEERRKQQEQDQREELRIQSEIQRESTQDNSDNAEGKYKHKRPKRLDPQFVQTQFACNTEDLRDNLDNNLEKADNITGGNEEDEYKETPSLAEVKASDINDYINNYEE